MIEAASQGWRAARVRVVDRDGNVAGFRLAVFIFDTPNGFVWVEPTYIDPLGWPSPASHERTGQVEHDVDTWHCSSEQGELITISEWTPAGATENERNEIAAYEAALKATGVGRQAERARVREVLAASGTFTQPAAPGPEG